MNIIANQKHKESDSEESEGDDDPKKSLIQNKDEK